MFRNLDEITRRNFLRVGCGSLLFALGCVAETPKDEYEIVTRLKDECKARTLFDIPGYSVQEEKWEPRDVTKELMGQKTFDSWKSFSSLYTAISSNRRWAIANIEEILNGFIVKKFNGQFGSNLLVDREKEKIFCLDATEDTSIKNSFSVCDTGLARYESLSASQVDDRITVADSLHSKKLRVRSKDSRHEPPYILTSPDGNIILFRAEEKRNRDMYDTLLRDSQGFLQPCPIPHLGIIFSHDAYVFYGVDLSTSQVISSMDFDIGDAPARVVGMNHNGSVLAINRPWSPHGHFGGFSTAPLGTLYSSYHRVDMKTNTTIQMLTDGESFQFSPDGNFCVSSGGKTINVFVHSPQDAFTVQGLAHQIKGVENDGTFYTASEKFVYRNGFYFLEGPGNPKMSIKKVTGYYDGGTLKQKIEMPRKSRA